MNLYVLRISDNPVSKYLVHKRVSYLDWSNNEHLPNLKSVLGLASGTHLNTSRYISFYEFFSVVIIINCQLDKFRYQISITS